MGSDNLDHIELSQTPQPLPFSAIGMFVLNDIVSCLILIYVTEIKIHINSYFPVKIMNATPILTHIFTFLTNCFF